MRVLSVLTVLILAFAAAPAAAQAPSTQPEKPPQSAQQPPAGPASAPGSAQQPPAQPPAPPPPPKPRALSGSLSAGISVTAGNRNTSNFNASFDLVHDPKTRNVFKTDALYLRGKSEKNVTGDQLRFGFYDEYRFNTRFFVFGQGRYLRDRFKEIDYLVAPATGMGYKVLDTRDASIGFAAGLGGVFEKDRGKPTAASGSLNIDQKLSYKFSQTATFTQAIAAIWKTTDFSDSLYTLRGTVAASLTQRAQLKLEVLDTLKNRVPAGTKKNDVALITGLVYKI